MIKPDLSGVDPLRRAEVARRIEAIESYMSLKTATSQDRLDHALLVGLSVNQFMTLVRAWRDYGDARAISQSGASKGKSRSGGARRLQIAVKQATDRAVASLPPGSPLSAAWEAVQKQCRADGVTPPSRATVWNTLMRLRRDPVKLDGDRRIIVGRVRLQLPVLDKDGLMMPIVTIALRALDGAVLAAAMPADAALNETIARSLRATYGSEAWDLHVDDAIAAPFVEGRPDAVRMVPTGARRAISAVLGNRIGDVSLGYNLGVPTNPDRLLRSRVDNSLVWDDARTVLKDRIDRHNAVRNAPPTLFV